MKWEHLNGLRFQFLPVSSRENAPQVEQDKRVALDTRNIVIIALEADTLLHAWKFPTNTTSAVTSCISLSSAIPVKGQGIGKFLLLCKNQ